MKQTNEQTQLNQISAPETLESKSVNKEQTSPTPHTMEEQDNPGGMHRREARGLVMGLYQA